MTCDYDHTLCAPLRPVTMTTHCVSVYRRFNVFLCDYNHVLCVSIQVLRCACSSVYHHILNRHFTVFSEWMMNADAEAK